MSPRWTPRSTITCAAEGRDEAEREAAKERARAIEARRAATAAAAGRGGREEGDRPSAAGPVRLAAAARPDRILREPARAARSRSARGDEARARTACRPDVRAPRREVLPRRRARPGRLGRTARVDRPRCRDRRPGGRGARGVAGRPGGGRRPGAAHGPGLRAERARRGRDGGPGRGPGCVAERSRPDHGRRRPGPPPAHDRAGRPAGIAARDRPGRPAPPGRPAARPVRSRVLAGHRGRRSRRVRPPWRDRGCLPAIDAAADPHRVLRRRDRLAARVRSDRPADRPDRRSRSSCCRRPSSCCRSAGERPSASGWAASRRGSRSGWQADLARFEGEGPGDGPGHARPRRSRRPPVPARPVRSRSATPPRSGRPSSRRRPAWTTSAPGRCCCSTSPATSPRPPSSCGARPTNDAPSSSRPTTCRRTGRPRTSRHATGRAGSWRRGPWS